MQRMKEYEFHSGLETTMRRRMSTQFGLVQGAPQVACAQDVEDRVGTGTIRHPRSHTPKATGIDMDWERRLEHGPQLIRNAESGRGEVVGRSLSLVLLDFLLAYTLQYSRVFGQAVRALPTLFLCCEAGLSGYFSSILLLICAVPGSSPCFLRDSSVYLLSENNKVLHPQNQEGSIHAAVLLTLP